jgi:Putative peptidoglycan binding domain
MSDELEEAILEFQVSRNIEADGELNQATKDALEKAYGA